MNQQLRSSNPMYFSEDNDNSVAKPPFWEQPKSRTLAWCNLCSSPIDCRKKAEHAWRAHVGVKVFKCSHCKYASFWRSNATSHILRRHEDGADAQLLDETEKYANKLRRAMTDCFGSPVRVVSTKGSWCRLCEKAVSKSSRSAHVWNVHLVVKAFKCAGCSFRGVRRQAVKAHISDLHGSVFVQILNEKQKYRQKYQEEWRKVMADCFLSKRMPNNDWTETLEWSVEL
ncbi:MAG: hypothetical protein GY820_03360 [Gammaproteobacteria bacterium]|nr:hypothetical protein [Gammaproteobacteria bacterium]